MSVKKEVFGEVNGETVYIVTLANSSGMVVEVLSYGAILRSVIVPDKDGKFEDVCLSIKDAETMAKGGGGYNGMVVGRYANRVGNAQYVINGKTYNLELSQRGPYALHSGSASYGRRNFTVADIDEKSNQVTMTLKDNGEGGFESKLDFSVTYAVAEDENSLSLTYNAICDDDTIVSFTNHCYLNLAGQASGETILDHIFTVNANNYTPSVDALPIGTIDPVEGTEFDWREPQRLGDMLEKHNMVFYDHNFAIDGSGFRLCGTAYDPKSGRFMETFCDLPGMHFFTTAGRDEPVEGKNGAMYGKYPGFCHETQNYPDAPNRPNFPSPIIKANVPYETKTVFRFSTK